MITREIIFGISAAAVLLGGLAPIAMAQDGPPDTWDDISVSEWRQMVKGRTVTYRIGGQLWAHEAYDTSGNRVAIRTADGSCMEGTWSYDNGAYCFAWDAAPASCFRHVRQGSEILIVPLIDGVPSGAVQTVEGVSDIPLNCGPDLTS
ncbi:MAG: hypothetical protein AAGB10_02205 [Pseudomonadota bacterium]